jgi:hypothetical protein
VADQFSHRSLGFINPLCYRLLGTGALHDIAAPASPVAQVSTDYANFLDNTQGVVALEELDHVVAQRHPPAVRVE